MRTFIAIEIPATRELESLHTRLARMKPAVKAVEVDQLHLTLAFLGETHEHQIPRIVERLRSIAGQMPRFQITLQGLGAFPRIERPGVVWVGIANSPQLAELAFRLDDMREELGFPPDTHPFTPHVTLGRVKLRPPTELLDLLQQNATTGFGTVAVDTVDLIESQLLPEGPRYITIASAPLE